MTQIVVQGPELEGLELLLEGLLPGINGDTVSAGASNRESVGERSGIDAGSTQACFELSRDRTVGLSVGDVIDLCDPENTPLASMAIANLRVTSELDTVCVTGRVRALREPAHGPAREARFARGDSLSASHVAVFRGAVTPADVLRAAQWAGGEPLVLVAEGSASMRESARLVRELGEAAALLPHTTVRFVPRASLGGERVDTLAVLRGLGAREVCDLRHPHAASDGGAVLLLTGLSGSGKSTVARALAERLNAESSHRAVLLDGDHLRAELAPELGFSREDRHRNLVRQAWVAARVAEAGGIAICAPIAPFAATRKAMREKVEPASRFVVIYVSTPLAVAEARDRKGLYARARAGEITDFTGIGSPYEAPTDADLTIDTSRLSVEECVTQIRALLYSAHLVEDG